MKLSIRGWVFLFFGVMALLNGGMGWLIFSRRSTSPGGLILVYLVVAIVMAAVLGGILLAAMNRAQQSSLHALERLSQNDLSRLSSALGALSGGDITIQIEPQSEPLHESLYPGSEKFVQAYNGVVEEIHQIYSQFNDVTDAPCQRLVFVGADLYREGRTCCEIMGELIHGQGKVAIVTGLSGQALEIRKYGFTAALNEKFPGVQVAVTIDGHGRAETVFPKLVDALKRIPDLAGIYVTDGDTPYWVTRALLDTGKARKVAVVCHDTVERTMQALRDGLISATISQDPYAQGHDPVIYLYNYLVCGQLPPRPKMTTHMDRITPENYSQFWDAERGALENAETQARRARPVDRRPGRGLRILVLGREDVPFFEPLKQGALAAGEELKSCGVVVEWIEPEEARKNHHYDAADYAPAIEAAIAAKVDALMVPVYDKALVPYINKAVAAGIPVATYNSEPSGLRSLMNSLISQSEQLRGISVDLAQSAAVSGERASQINASIGEMTQALYDEVAAATQAIASTEQIAQAITNISAGAQEQSAAVNSVTAAIDAITTAVSSTDRTALDSQSTAEQAVQTARQGAETIQLTLSQIQEISAAVSASVAQIHELNKISRQISSIVGTVADFAEQTNMLALNAAIEAARAGEAGSGFAVVAVEIRNLAEMSRRSTKEISALIRDVQQNASKMVKTVDDAMSQAQSGRNLAAQAGEALGELLKSAETMKTQTEKVVQANASVVDALDTLTGANRRVSAVVEENAAATRQVTENVQQTVEMVNHMTGISRANSTSIEAVHASTDDVAERANRLKESIESLVTMAEEMQGAVAAFKIE